MPQRKPSGYRRRRSLAGRRRRIGRPVGHRAARPSYDHRGPRPGGGRTTGDRPRASTASSRAWRRCFAHMNGFASTCCPAPRRPRRRRGTRAAAGRAAHRPRDRLGAAVAAAETLAERARQQRMGYDAEQQRVLTTLLGSTFIEHLKDRLDHTARRWRGSMTQLDSHPTRTGTPVRVHGARTPGTRRRRWSRP